METRAGLWHFILYYSVLVNELFYRVYLYILKKNSPNKCILPRYTKIRNHKTNSLKIYRNINPNITKIPNQSTIYGSDFGIFLKKMLPNDTVIEFV